MKLIFVMLSHKGQDIKQNTYNRSPHNLFETQSYNITKTQDGKMNTIEINSRGPSVYYLQLALERSGYLPGNIDGIFGKQTQKELIKFQLDNKLFPDGIAGPKTWKKLLPVLLGYTTYVVQPGDTIYKISRRLFSSVDAILTANPNVLPANLQIGTTLIIPYTSFDIVSSKVPVTHEISLIWTEGLLARYPFIKAQSIGNSVLGNRITCLSIGNGGRQIMVNASHHANESITTTVVMKYCENAAKKIAAGRPFPNVSLHVIPLVNPDGVDLVNGALEERADSAYEKAKTLAAGYPQIPFPSGWKANINGVDLNLNYPAQWELAREIKFSQGFTKPGPRDYVGSSPLCQPESRALVSYTNQNNFDVTLSYHTQGNIIYWKYDDYEPPYSLELGNQLSEASGYPLAITPYASGYAGYKDWFIQTYDKPGYTIECGIGINPLPLSQFDAIFASNEPLIDAALSFTPQ